MAAASTLSARRQRLIDRLDAIFLGIARVGDRCFLAIDEDLTGIALVGAGQDLDQRRLARAVVPKQRHDFAGVEVAGGIVDSANAAEGDGDVPHVDQRQ